MISLLRIMALPCLGLLLFALGGCATGRVYVRPPIPLPAAWQASAGKAEESCPAPAWWNTFGLPELDWLEETARQGNPDLRASLSRIRQAQAAANIAGANLYPSLQAEAGTVRTGGGQGSKTNFETRLTAAYELDLWGKNRLAREAAQAALEGTIFAHEAAKLSLSGEVATIYFRLLAINDRLAIAGDALAVADRTLAIMEKRQQAGRISLLDLAQARTNRAQVEAAFFSLEAERQRTANALAILVGALPGGAVPETIRLMEVGMPSIPAGLPAALLERRPDLRAAEAALVSANAVVGAAKANLLPGITLTAAGGYASTDLASLLRPDSLFHSLGAGLLAPIFQGGRLQGEYELSQARFEELGHNYHRAALVAFAEVEDALAAIKQLAGSEAALAEAAAEAGLSHRLALRRYEAGKSDYLPALEAEKTWLATHNALTETRLARLNALSALQVALGGGWDTASLAEWRPTPPAAP